MTRVFLTGSGGFVGHHVLEHILTTTDWEVVCTDSFRHSGKVDRIAEVLDNNYAPVRDSWRERTTVVTQDLTVPISAQTAEKIGHIDAIISMASESHVDRSIAFPDEFIRNNVHLILNLLEYHRTYAPDAIFLQISTDEVYGPAPEGHNHKEWESFYPSNPYCVHPDTKIMTTKGWIKIQDYDIKRDHVLTRSKRKEIISGQAYQKGSTPNKWVKNYSGDMVTIKTNEGRESITCTPEHVLFRIENSHSSGGRKIAEVSADQILVGDRLVVARKIPEAIDAFNAGQDFARFLGYYYADGSYSSRSKYVRIADEKTDYLDYYKKICKSLFGVSKKSSTGEFGTIYKHGTKNCWYLQFASENQRDMVDLSTRDSIMSQIATWDEESLSHFLGGWIDGDGSITVDDKGRVKVVEICCFIDEHLEMAKWAFRRLGIISQIDFKYHKIRVTHSEDIQKLYLLVPTFKWPVLFKTAKPQKIRSKNKNFVLARVISTEKTPYSGKVYDLEVTKYNNYTADYFIVHNSASKASQESISFSYWRTFGTPLILTNTMNIVGQRQDPEKFVPMVIKKVLNDEVVTIHASPEGQPGSRYYLHARNQADALVFLLKTYLDGTHPLLTAELVEEGENIVYTDGCLRPPKYHIVGEREVDNLEMAELIAKAVGKPLKYELVNFHESRPGHDLRYALDGSKIQSYGWEAPVAFEESLEQTVKWTLDHPEWLL